MQPTTIHIGVVSSQTEFVAALADVNPGRECGWRYRYLPLTGDPDSLRELARDPLLQGLLIDASGARASGAELTRLRPEVDLVAICSGDGPEQLAHRLHQRIARRAATPFADTLRDYVANSRDAWHTPGHSGGASFRDSPWVRDFHGLMGDHVFRADLSVSVQALDSLLDPRTIIHEAQALAAEAFGARRTFFVTNGTSTANKVIVQHLLGAGGKLILDQACHKSMHHAVVLAGVEPVYLQASFKPEFGLYGPVPQRRVIQVLDENPDAGLLALTSCTYDGFCYDLEPIIAHAHSLGIRVLVDEAWYAHGRFHPALRPNALDCGADYVTQSTHKMLSAFSQASMIHVADPDFDEARFREDLNMHTSTSPQYAMIASLDVARKQMSMEGFGQLQACIDQAERITREIDATGVFRVLRLADMLPDELAGDPVRIDPTKLTIDISASGRAADEIQLTLYERFGIQVEKTTHNTLTVLVTLGTTEDKLGRLCDAIATLARETRPESRAQRAPLRPPGLGTIMMQPRQAYFGRGEVLPLLDESGRLNPQLPGAISADQVVPYPPGIPVLVPGQEITPDVLDYLEKMVAREMEIHGLQQTGGVFGLRVARRRPLASVSQA